MSDEEESASDGFSASEDEWKPGNCMQGDITSEEDDSDVDKPKKQPLPGKPATKASSKTVNASNNRKRKAPQAAKGSPKRIPKRRKGAGQSLRMKLFKRYNPPPKTSPLVHRNVGMSSSSNSSSSITKKCKDHHDKPEEEHKRKLFSYEFSDGATSDSVGHATDNDLMEQLSDPSYYELRTDSTYNNHSTPPQQQQQQQLEEEPAVVTYDFKSFFDNVQYLEQMEKNRKELSREQKNGAGGDVKSTATDDLDKLLAMGEKLDCSSFKRNYDDFEDDDGDDDDDMFEHSISRRKAENKSRDAQTKKRSMAKSKDGETANKCTKDKTNRIKSHSKSKRSTNPKEDLPSDISDWEEVSGNEGGDQDTHEPADGVEIHIPLLTKKEYRSLKRQEEREQEMKRKFNNEVRSHQVLLHKASLLCRFARSYRYNRLLNATTLMQTVLKILPSKNAYPTEGGTEIKYYRALVDWFKDTIYIDVDYFYVEKRKMNFQQYLRHLSEQIIKRKALCKQDYVFMFVALIRAMGLQCRLLVNMKPIPLKPDKSKLLPINVKSSEDMENDHESGEEEEEVNSTKNSKAKSSKSKDGERKNATRKSHKKATGSREKSETATKGTTSKKQKTKSATKEEEEEEEQKDDSSETSKGSKNFTSDMWPEVWCDKEDQWAYVDLFRAKVDTVGEILKASSAHVTYVFAFQNNLSYKDVTDRYCPSWTTNVRTWRVDRSWLEKAFSRYKGERTIRDCKEDMELRLLQEKMPVPTTIHECKNHPLYALRRHLLKFEAIYPPTAPTVGFIRGEPIYPRECVHTLHSRDIWLKQARVVKKDEKPYKIVKSRPKWDRGSETVIKDLPLEIFGYWQTTEYEPPTAENGIVPRNGYGNVELFQPQMLPKKTVHIRLAGLNRICRKLGIDCANAVVGFDFHQGACHPAFDGFVVCEEFADIVTEAWYEDQEIQRQKEQDKYLARVYGNWKKLVRGVLIREQLKQKYKL